MAPLTRPCLVLMFLRNITRAPTASVSSASRPAVKLLSLLSFSSCFWAFLVHLCDDKVSSISSMHTILCTSVSKAESILSLNSLHAFLVGNKQTGEEPPLLNSTYLSTTGTSITHIFKHSKLSGEGEPRRT